jgi:hypothetical protein
MKSFGLVVALEAPCSGNKVLNKAAIMAENSNPGIPIPICWEWYLEDRHSRSRSFRVDRETSLDFQGLTQACPGVSGSCWARIGSARRGHDRDCLALLRESWSQTARSRERIPSMADEFVFRSLVILSLALTIPSLPGKRIAINPPTAGDGLIVRR